MLASFAISLYLDKVMGAKVASVKDYPVYFGSRNTIILRAALN